MNQLKEKVDIKNAIAIISEYYHLDSKAVSKILQAFKNITPEQCKKAAVILAKFATKEMNSSGSRRS
ncbi:MAG: hypothetical protein K2H89_02300 [Oscillospiraceae bacterium]|nr:hypothetical protein [Oscillospiraceae bacterium]